MLLTVGSRVERAKWLRTLPVYLISRWEELGSAWDIRDDLAVHLHTVEMTAVVGGTNRSGTFALTDTWLRGEDGAWRVWIRHSTPFSAGDMPRT